MKYAKVNFYTLKTLLETNKPYHPNTSPPLQPTTRVVRLEGGAEGVGVEKSLNIANQRINKKKSNISWVHCRLI
jgi:hypothetical protein